MPPTHWRNILHHDEEPDEAMQRIDARVARLEELPDAVRHLRVLKRLSGRERRHQKRVNHEISKPLVTFAKKHGLAVVFEDSKASVIAVAFAKDNAAACIRGRFTSCNSSLSTKRNGSEYVWSISTRATPLKLLELSVGATRD